MQIEVSHFLKQFPWKSLLGATAGIATLSLGFALRGMSTGYPPSEKPPGGYQQPKKTRLRTISLYYRVYSLRFLSKIMGTLIGVGHRPSVVLRAGEAKNPVRSVIFYPPHTTTRPSKLPVMINAHGGGFVGGHPEDDDEFCRLMAEKLGIVVVSVDYRVAPENPPPAGALDLVESAKWAAEFYQTDTIIMCGSSAGGALAYSAATHIKSTGSKFNVIAAVAFYPPVDLSATAKTEFEDKNPYGKMLFYEAYLRDIAPDRLTDPLISPIYAAASDFPPTTILIDAGLDPNNPNIQELSEKLRTAPQINFVRRTFPQVPHGWNFLPTMVLRKLGKLKSDGGPGDGVEAKEEAFEAVVQALSVALSRSTS